VPKRCVMSMRPTEHSIDDARRWFASWLRDTRDLSPHTVRAYSCDVAALVRSVGGATPLDALTPNSILDFFEKQRSEGICSSSLRRRACGLRTFCAFLERQGHLVASPWPNDGLTFRRTRSLPRALPRNDLTQLMTHLIRQAGIDDEPIEEMPLPHPDAASTLLATALLVTTGLRVTELVTFRVADLDLSNRNIHVMGKGRRERVVYITNDWIAHLTSAYLTERDGKNITHDCFFFNAAGRPLTTASMRMRLANAAQSAGLRRRVTPHMLRHTAATQLIESGVDIRFVQRLLGHSSLATTEIYTHVTNRALRHAVVSADVLTSALGVSSTDRTP
jgi:site-specific recombinase XerD